MNLFLTGSEGFGRYLHTQDPLARDWRWQLCNTIKLCEAHFRRGIAAACGSLPRTSDSVHHRMEALLLAPTWEAFQENVQLLISKDMLTRSEPIANAITRE